MDKPNLFMKRSLRDASMNAKPNAVWTLLAAAGHSKTSMEREGQLQTGQHGAAVDLFVDAATLAIPSLLLS